MHGEEGSTNFHLVTSGIHAARKQATEAAKISVQAVVSPQFGNIFVQDSSTRDMCPRPHRWVPANITVAISRHPTWSITAPNMCRRRTRLTSCSRKRGRRSKIVDGPHKVISRSAIAMDG